MIFLKKDKKRYVKQCEGFTVIEMMITLGVVVLVTGMVMVRYTAFNSSILLSSQTYLLAFDIREAQSLAISVRGDGGEFREEYGVYFDIATPNKYILFQDSSTTQDPPRYDSGEQINEYTIDPRFTIVDICVTSVSSGRQCGLSNVSISFARPDFDAKMYSSEVSGALISTEIALSASSNSVMSKTVEVTSSGQISVKNIP